MPTFISYLQLVRAPNGLTAISNIIAALCLSYAFTQTSPVFSHCIALCCASLCFYFAGMALNDFIDFDEDTAERPNRPIPSGLVSKKSALILIGTLTTLGLCLSAFVSTQAFLVSIFLCATIIAYDVFIRTGLIGAFTMASCRYMNWLLGLSIVPLQAEMLLWPLPIVFYIAGLTYLSKQETKAEDPKALRISGLLLAFAALALIYIAINSFSINIVGASLVFAWIAFALYKLAATLNNFTPAGVQATVMWMIIGIIPLDALLVAVSGNYIAAAAVLLLFFPCRYLSKQLYMT